MELSHSLSRVTRFLLQAEAGAVEVFVHDPQDATRGLHVAVCEWQRETGKRLKASGVAATRFEAYIKAVAELGEVVLCHASGLESRAGIAGGLFASNAVLRAKAELLERDAFLFHYRNRVPFLRRESARAASGAGVFEMSSAEKGRHCFIALDEAFMAGGAECVLMGFGCHADRELAAAKALGELACMSLDHAMRPGWCRDVYEGRSRAARLTDFHHAFSRDPRNRERIRALCRTDAAPAPSRRDLVGEWRVETLKSPLRYFKYVRVFHDGLVPLEFGRPEPSFEGTPLYHPVW